ncbi:MAG: hydroxyacid dehydrogenase [Candidatus Brocadiia bacterium]
MVKVLVCDSIDKSSIARLQELGYEVTEKTGMAEADLIATIPAYHAMIVRSATKVTAKVIDAAANLKVVLRGGVGIDNIDKKAADAKGIKVLNTPAASSLAVAELTVGLMFSLARRTAKADGTMQAGKWEKKRFEGSELNGKTLGLVGSGRIGSEVARLASLIGMNVIAYDPYISEFRFGKLVKTVDEILAASDYISLHVPLTDETRNLINATAIAKMKKTAFVINCARGGVVDEVAFAAATREGKVGGGAFDVYGQEPPVNSPLVGIEGIVLTPHIGASTFEAQSRIGGEIVKLLGKELPAR